MSNTSPNPEPQFLLESGPMLIRDFNPKAILRFTGRKCMNCKQEILDHWLIDSPNLELKGTYWCDKAGTNASEGMEV